MTDAMMQLNNSTAQRPREQRPVRVLQFGEGNFLRAFFDWMIDVANDRGVTDTSVAVVSPRFRANATIAALQRQDGLYHVCLEGVADGSPRRETRLVTSVADSFSPADDPERYMRYITSPDLRFVVSNTTEAGIRFEPDDPASLTAATFPAKVTAMLYHRFRHFGGDPERGLIFLCCELIEDNGRLLREYVLRHAREAHLGEDFERWVAGACIFCDTLVDRIVSGFPADTIDSINASTGYDDSLVVKGELYHLWVIGGEGAATVERELPLDRAGLNVHFLPSVKEFRDRKVRVLNGSHTGMVPVALLSGCETVLDAFANEDVNAFITAMVEREVLPVIDGDPVELKRFADGILERFYNPYIRHMLRSIALNSLSKWETRNFPTVRDFYARFRRLPQFEIFTFAALLALYAPGSGFTPDDNPAHVAFIRDHWNPADLPASVKAIVEGVLFIDDFEAAAPGFSDEVGRHLESIQRLGMPAALRNFLDAQR